MKSGASRRLTEVEASQIDRTDFQFRVTLELGKSVTNGRETIKISEMIGILEKQIAEHPDHPLTGLFAQMQALLRQEADKAKEIPIRSRGSYGPCPSCWVSAGNRGQIYYSDLGFDECRPC
jgi:hypothetical protein